MRPILGTFQCAAGDSFDSLSLLFFGDEKYAGDLMNANPESSGKIVFDGGEEIYIPVIEEAEESSESKYANTIAPWKEE